MCVSKIYLRAPLTAVERYGNWLEKGKGAAVAGIPVRSLPSWFSFFVASLTALSRSVAIFLQLFRLPIFAIFFAKLPYAL